MRPHYLSILRPLEADIKSEHNAIVELGILVDMLSRSPPDVQMPDLRRRVKKLWVGLSGIAKLKERLRLCFEFMALRDVFTDACDRKTLFGLNILLVLAEDKYKSLTSDEFVFVVVGEEEKEEEEERQ